MRAAAWLWVALAACPAPPEAVDTDTDPVPRAVGDPLAEPAYRFCHRDGVDAEDLPRFCALLADAPPEACPAMRRACEARAFGSGASGCGGGGGEAAQGTVADTPEAPSAGCEAPTATPDGLEALVRWAMALGAAAVLMALGMWLLSRLGVRRPTGVAPAPASSVDAEESGDDTVPRRPADGLLAEAEAALAQGRTDDAVVLARAASLRHLADAGVVRLARTRTDREHVRSVPASADRDALATVVRAAEQVRWGRRPTDAAGAAQVLAVARRLVGVALLCALALPARAAPGSRYGPWGDAGLRAILEDAGYDVVRGVTEFSELTEDHDVLWLDLLFVDPGPDGWDAIREWVGEGGVLIVGGDPSPGFDGVGLHRLATGESVVWVRYTGLARQHLLDARPAWPGGSTYEFCMADDTSWSAFVFAEEAADTDVVAPSDTDAVVCAERALVTGWGWGDGALVMVADASVFANAALILPENRAFLAELPWLADRSGARGLPPRPRVVLATSGRVPRDASDPGPLANPRALPLVAQLALVWLLAVPWLAARRVPARDPDAPVRVDLLAHADALATHVRRSGDGAWAAQRVAAWAVEAYGVAGLTRAAATAGEADPARWAARVVAIAEGRDAGDLSDVEAVCRTLGRW